MYNVQCLCGHVGTAPFGSELEARCKAHQAKGFPDALLLGPKECPSCQCDAEMRDRSTERAMADWQIDDL